jgi:predicted enzyme related to lactoylglutathione lyase
MIAGEPKMLLGVRTVVYPAPALEVAKLWYTKVLSVEPYFDEPFYVGFSVGSFELGLVPDGTPGITGSQALWQVEDASIAFARLLQLGATQLEPITEVGGGILIASVIDPAGNRLGILQTPA